MKITSVEIHPEGSSQVVVLSFRDPRRLNPYNIVAISGLDADEVIPRLYRGSGSKRFYNLSLEKREIMARVQLNPDYSTDQTFSDLRDNFYKMIASSRTGLIQFQFKNGTNIIAAISGFVTKMEAPLFEKNPELQITVNCTGDKMLKAPVATSIDVGTLNEAALNFQDLLSTAPHGFKAQFGFSDAVPGFLVTDPNDPDWEFEATPVGGFLAGDILAFSSEPDDKYLFIIRGASVIFLADVITPNSVWPIMFPGDNLFEIEYMDDISIMEVLYFPTYWGV